MNYNIFLLSCLVFLFMDSFWIYYNYKYYNDLIFKIQKEPISFKPIIIPLTYIFIFMSLYYCIRLIELELKKKDYIKIILISFLFGISIYGIYSYTTCIFLKNYSYTNAFIDTLWGGILYLVSSLLYFYII
jgi:uncharacterized membrane protein